MKCPNCEEHFDIEGDALAYISGREKGRQAQLNHGVNGEPVKKISYC